MQLKTADHTKYYWYIKEVVTELFTVLIVTYLLLYTVSNMYSDFVSEAINMNFILWLTIGSGILSVLFDSSPVPGSSTTNISWKRTVAAGLVSIASIGIMYYKIQSIGWRAFVLCILSGGLIFYLSMLAFNNENND